MNKHVLRKIQLSEIFVLDEIDRICRENNIIYYLAGGTLLGAVRHKGFIPWDDDLDISMPREDYEKFINLCEEKLSDDFVCQSSKTDCVFNLYLTKIRLKNTSLVDKRNSYLKINHGIYVDIFPLDNAKKFGFLLKLRALLFGFFARVKTVKIGVAHPVGIINNILKYILSAFLILMPIRAIDGIVKLIMKRNYGGNYYVNLCSQYGYKKQTMPSDWFGKGIPLEFEGKQYNAPTEYEKVLSHIYGDYLTIPPKEKQTTVHEFVHIDLGKWDSEISERMKNN